VVQTNLIALFDQLETAFLETAHHVGRMIHLAVAVGDAGEVKRGLLQAEGGGFVGLPVPEELENIQRAAGRQGPGHALQDGHDFALRKTSEKLAHPDDIVALGKHSRFIQHVNGQKVDPLFQAIIDAGSLKAVGVASFMRMDPANGVIEVGGLNYSPLLQRKPAPRPRRCTG